MSTDTIDPKARELDDAFADAMSRPARPRSEPTAPPELDPQAPFGRDEAGDPIAKYGYKNDGSLRLAGGGRKSQSAPDRPRVADEAPTVQAGDPGPAPSGHDYTEAVADTADGIWLAVTAASKLPLHRLRIGKYGLPADIGDRIGAQAFVLSHHKYRLAAALNEAAKHSDRARRLAEKCEGGDLSWVLTVGALALPAMFQSAAIWKGDASLREMEMPTRAELARRNSEQMGRYMDQLKDLASMIQAQADAQEAA